MALLTAKSIFQLCLLILAGIVASKLNIIKKDSIPSINGMILNIGLPALLLRSFQSDILFEHKAMLMQGIELSAICLFLQPVIAFILVRKGEDRNLERACLGFSNNAFIAIPLLTAIFGEIGTFYAATANQVGSVLFFGLLPAMVTGNLSKKEALKKTLLNNNFIICIFASILVFMNFRIPAFLMTPIGYMADITTPLAMMSIGTVIANADFHSLISKRVLQLTFTRLIVVSLIICFIFRMITDDPTIRLCYYVLACTPTASLVSIYAQNAGMDTTKSSGVFLMTTVCSAITIPLIVLILTSF